MSSKGEVRLLPTGGDGNAILCRSCLEHEISIRRRRNAELAAQKTGTSFDLPKWEDLKVYEP
jgi:hypothetical protein